MGRSSGEAMGSASVALACLLVGSVPTACSAPAESEATSSAGATGQGAAAAAGGQGAGASGAPGGTAGQGAVVVFSWARAGNTCGTGPSFGFGSRGHPELQAVHQEIWADLTAGP